MMGTAGLTGCPINCRHYGKKMDYAKVRLPAVEHASYAEQLTIPHHLFVYGENVPKLAAAFHKVHENLNDVH